MPDAYFTKHCFISCNYKTNLKHSPEQPALPILPFSSHFPIKVSPTVPLISLKEGWEEAEVWKRGSAGILLSFVFETN